MVSSGKLGADGRKPLKTLPERSSTRPFCAIPAGLSVVGLFVDAGYGASAGVVDLGKRCVPGQGFGRAAGYARYTRDRLGGAVAWEMLGEDGTIVILLLVL